MSTHEHDHEGGTHEPGSNLPVELHERLCALVLGELDGAEREALEAELEGSPELRAERVRIESTIGLVRAACGGPESLSDSAVARLEGLAGTPSKPWYTSTTLRMAAGFGIVAVSLALLQEGRARRMAPAELASDGLASAGLASDGRAPAEESIARLFVPKEERAANGRYDEKSKDVLGDLSRRARATTGEDAVERFEDRQAVDARDLELAEAMVRAADRARSQMAPNVGRTASLESVSEDERLADALTAVRGLRAKADSLQLDEEAKAGYVVRDEGLSLTQAVTELGVLEDGMPADKPSTLLMRGEVSGSDPLATAGAEIIDLYQFDFDVEAAGGAGNKAGLPDASAESDRIDPGSLNAVTAAPSTDPAVRFESFTLGGLNAPAEAPAPPASASAAGAHRELRKATRGRGRSSSSPAGPSPSGPSSPGPVAESAWARGYLGGGGGGGSASTPPKDAPVGGVLYELENSLLGEDLEAIDRRAGAFGDDDGDDGELELRSSFGLAYEREAPRELDPEALARQRVDRVLQDCRRRPQEQPSMMYFRFWGDNGFELAQLDAQSTFSVDVDTASYALARRYLTEGHLPEKAQIRTEEFVNYFDPDVPAPLEETFKIHTDLAPSRFGSASAGGIRVSKAGERWMLRVVVRGKEVSRDERQPLALTFVVDTSGSMKEENRLELVKHSLRLLMTELDARDSISIVAFSNEARMVLPMTSASQRALIEAAIYGLNPDGGTNAEAGLLMGYAQAAQHLSNAAQSRVVLLSDGVANIGQTDQDRINGEVERQRSTGIFLNTIGVGMGNHNDTFLEQLADKGDGLCNYVDSEIEARRALVENFTGAFTPIARDVKVQVEFDPTQVYRYRQLGYENRAIADVDFRNDAVDAGEVGAGHQVVALYELELLKPGGETPLAEVRLRYKAAVGAGRDPLEDSATEISAPVLFDAASAWEGSSEGYKRSVLVAQFAELLRRSTHAREDSLDELIAESAALAPRLNDADFTEFLAMVEKSRELVLRARPAYEPISHCVDRLRRNRCLSAEYEALKLDQKHALLDDLERQNRELEARIRDLIHEQVQSEYR